MGSIFQLFVGEVEFISGKNHISSFELLPFQSSDLHHEEAEDGEPTRHAYETTAAIIALRLDILGHTLHQAEEDYADGVEGLEDWDRERFPQHLLTKDGYSAWRATVVADALRVQKLSFEHPPSTESMRWEDHHLGFPSGSVYSVLRALVDVVPPETLVSLDLTDLLSGGWISDDPNLCSVDERTPVIIVGEGTSDTRILTAALETLFPEVTEFLTFIDYETANAKGGTAEMVRFVRMFVGCGIKNRIVVLFDNDAAGHEALSLVNTTPLPENVFAMCLPPLERFKAYPTEGPDGRTISDIDGRGCSIELYLGAQALVAADGSLRPVRWGGFNERVKRYQGAIDGKGEIEDRFHHALSEVRADPLKRSAFDFSGVEAIFEAIFSALASAPH